MDDRGTIVTYLLRIGDRETNDIYDHICTKILIGLNRISIDSPVPSQRDEIKHRGSKESATLWSGSISHNLPINEYVVLFF